ncbi:MAG TPA: response regulator transcription factor [Cyclobacteriaceae bacterium]|jgi:DNA-binding response OmpR family regulator|nr:response regulator transcription factor [Cyclobacteriaceae bacterium]
MKILTVEDEFNLLESIQEYLMKENYECDGASSLTEGIERISNDRYDCILLDITLPDGNGLKLLDRIAEQIEPPTVIIISAKNSLDDKIAGLDLGADDYLTKPFHLSELNSRIKAVARRKGNKSQKYLVVGNVSFDLINNQALIDEKSINLTKKEFDILFYLAENRDRVLSKSMLVKHIWGDTIYQEQSFNFLFSHIKNIKNKLRYRNALLSIRTVYGLGYQLRSDLQESA